MHHAAGSRLAGQQHAQGIQDYAAAYRSGRTTPLLVAQRAIDALRAGESWDPPQHYLEAWNQADILRQAEESRTRHARP